MVSVVVPIYKGESYISGLIKNIEACASLIGGAVELLLVNDYPEQPLENRDSDILDITIINSESNEGIHASRIKGLLASKGELIWFLDQDDKVDDNYLKSQLEKIGYCDAVICLAKENERDIYSGNRVLSESVLKENLYDKGNYIRSPGQALIRRESIPDKWVTDIIRHNCSDDYFLWICMVNNNSTFAFNYDTYYYHMDSGNNASNNITEMFLSTREVINACGKNYLSDCDLNRLENAEINRVIRIINSKDRVCRLYEKMLQCHENKHKICDYFQKESIENISIYGIGKIGTRLYYLLKGLVHINHLYDKCDLSIDGRKTERVGDTAKDEMIILALANPNVDRKIFGDARCVDIDEWFEEIGKI